MDKELLHIIELHWKDRYKKVYFNKNVEYWGYSRVKFVPFSSLMLDYMQNDLSGVEVRLILAIVSKVKWTRNPIISGGTYVAYKDFSYVCSRKVFFSAMSNFKSHDILYPLRGGYCLFNEKFIYKIRNTIINLK